MSFPPTLSFAVTPASGSNSVLTTTSGFSLYPSMTGAWALVLAHAASENTTNNAVMNIIILFILVLLFLTSNKQY